MELRLTLLALLCASSALAGPLSSKCASKCSRSNENFQYQLGNTYHYDFQANNRLRDDEVAALNGKALVSPLGDCDFVLQLTGVSQIVDRPLVFAFDDGRVTDICPSPDEEPLALNLKKAIISALQVQLVDGSKVVRETDVLGTCETTYETLGQSYRGTQIRKTKRDCSERPRPLVALFPRKYLSLSTPLLSQHHSCDVLVQNQIVQSATCSDKLLNAVESTLKLSLSTVRKTQTPIAPRSFHQRQQLLLSASSPFRYEATEESAIRVMRDLCSKMENEIRPEAPEMFNELVYTVRELPHDVVSRLYKSNICPKMQDTFGDALVMAGSEASIRQIAELITREDVSPARSFYWLSMLFFNQQPTERSLSAALPLLQIRNRLRRPAWLGVSSLVHNYCFGNKLADCHQSPVVKEIVDTIIAEINGPDAVVAMKALANIGLPGHSVSKILHLVEHSSVEVRLAALEVLEHVACDPEVKAKAWNVLQRKEENPEVRIAAYKCLVKCPDHRIQEILALISNEQSKQVVAFIVSHLQNAIKSDDPMKKPLQDALSGHSLPAFPRDFTRYSRNFEFSQHFQQLDVGAVIEGDLIYDESTPIARSMKLNVSLLAQHSLFNIIEIGVRQKGLETVVQSLVSHNRFDIIEILNEVRRQIANQMEGSVYVKLDGKYVMFISVEDVKRFSRDDLNMVIAEFVRRMTIDWSVSQMFVNTVHTLPTVNGMPVMLDLNGTAMFAFKNQNNVFYPSAAFELSAQLTSTGSSRPALRWTSVLHTAPAFGVDVVFRNNRPVKLIVSLPKHETEVFTYKSFIHGLKGETGYSRDFSGCTKQLSRPLGIEACVKASIPKPFFKGGPISFQYFIKKTDTRMNGWEFVVELPSAQDQSSYNYHLAFDTPQSSINRQLSAQLQVDGIRSLRLQLVSPLKSLDMLFKWHRGVKEWLSKFSLKVDQRPLYAVEAGIQREDFTNKFQYKPRLIVRFQGAKPLVLGGTVLVETGRRSQIIFDLGRKEQQLKGKIIKEGQSGKQFRLSSDVSASLGFLNLRLVCLADKNPKSNAMDCKIEYQTPRMTKQSVRLVSKVQDTSALSLNKWNAFWEMSFTEVPELNFHINLNVLNKLYNHLETQFVFKWGPGFRQEIDLLQVSKFNAIKGPRLAKMAKMEHLLRLTMSPFNRDYEFQVNGNVEHSETPKLHFDFLGKEKRQAHECQGSLDFQHVSKKPLHLSVDAQLKYPHAHFRYSDNLREESPNEYHGKSLMQWHPDKQVAMDYKYRVKSDGQKTLHHEFDFDLATPSAPMRHSGLLRMTPTEFQLDSKLDFNNRNLWDGKCLLSKHSPSSAHIDTPLFNAKANRDQTQASFELNGKALQHRTDIVYPADQLTFATKTIYKNQPLLKISSLFSKPRSKFALNSSPLNVNFDYDATPFRGKLEVRSSPLSHLSTLNTVNNKLVLKSESKLNNEHLATVEGNFSPNEDSFLKVDTPHVRGQLNTSPWTAPLKTAKLQLKGIRYPFQLESDFQCSPNSGYKMNWKTSDHIGRFEASPFAKTKVASLYLNDKRSAAEHSSKIEISPSRWAFHSKTNGIPKINSLSLNGQLDDKYSNLKLKVDQTMGTLEYRPRQSAAFEISGNDVYHKSLVRRMPKSFELYTDTSLKGQKVFKVESALHKDAKSTISLETTTIKGNLDVDPFKEKSAKLAFSAYPYSHNTDLSWRPNEEFKLNSLTKKHDENWAQVDSVLRKNSKSFVKFIGKPFDASVELFPRSLKFDYTGKTKPVQHTTELNCQPKEWSIDSKTLWQGRPYTVVNGKLSRQSPSYFKLNSDHIDADINVNPYSTEKSLSLLLNKKYGTPLVHSSNFRVVPKRYATITSNTHYDSQPLYKLDSKFSTIEPSTLSVSTDPWNLNVNVDPYSKQKRASLELKGKHYPIYHNTQIAFTPRKDFEFVTKTAHGDKKFFNLRTNWVKAGQTDFDLNTVPLNLHFKMNPYADERVGEWRLQHNQLNHESSVKYRPASYLHLYSNTSRFDKNLFNFNTKLSAAEKSQLNVGFPNWQHSFEVDPRAKTAVYRANNPYLGYSHKTSGELGRDSLQVDSLSTLKGRQVATFNTFVSRKEPSRLNFDSNSWSGKLNVSPFSASKKLNWQLSNRRTSLEHNCEFSHQPGSLFINSNTKYGNRPQIKFNTKLDYQGPEKFGKLMMSWYPLQHDTQMKVNPDLFQFDTNSRWNNKDLFNLKSNLGWQQSSVQCQNPLFDVKCDLNQQNHKKELTLDYLAKHAQNRHILGSWSSTHASPANIYEMDLKWDADRNPNEAVKLRLSSLLEKHGILGKSQRQLQLDGWLNNKYNLVVDTNANENDLLKGPNSFSVKLTSPDGIDEWKFSHNLDQGHCKAEYFKNGKRMTLIENKFMFQNQPGKLFISESFELSSEYKSIGNMKLTFTHTNMPGHMQTIFSANLLDMKPILFDIKSNHQLSAYKGLVSLTIVLDTPISDFRHQQLTLSTEWNGNGEGKLNGEFLSNANQKVALTGTFKIKVNEQSLSLNCDSDFPKVPDMKLNANLVNGNERKVCQFNVDYENARVIDLDANIEMKNIDVSVDSNWTPKIQLKTLADRTNNNYLLSLKKNDDEIFDAKLVGSRKGREITYNGAVSTFGSNLAEVSVLNSDEDKAGYDMDIKVNKILKLWYKKINNGNEIKQTLKVCPNICYNVEAIISDNSAYSYSDQVITLSFQSENSPKQFRFEYEFNTHQQILSKAVIVLPDKKFGYELRTAEKSGSMKIYLLRRIVSVQAQLEENHKITLKIMPNMLNHEDVFTLVLFYKNELNRYARSIQAEAKLSHPILMKQPVGFSITANAGGVPKPLDAQLSLKYGQKEREELVLSALLENPNANPRNSSLTLKINDPEYKLVHFEIQTHLGSTERHITFGVNSQWLDPHRGNQRAFFLLSTDIEKRQMKIISWCPKNNVNLEGDWQIVNDVITLDGDLTVNGQVRKAHATLEMKEKPCLELQLLKDPAIQTMKWHACVDTEGSRVLKIISESWTGTEKSTDMSVIFDRRGRRLIRGALHWNPEIISSAFFALEKGLRQEYPLFNPFFNEASRKMRTICTTAYNDIARPLSEKLSHECDKLKQEMSETLEPIVQYADQLKTYLPNPQQYINLYWSMIHKFTDLLSRCMPERLQYIFDEYLRKVTRALTAACSRDSVCFSLAYSYERNGMKGLLQEAEKLSLRGWHQWEHSIYKTTGNFRIFLKNMLSAEWKQKFNDAMICMQETFTKMLRPVFDSAIGTKLTNMYYKYMDFLNNNMNSLAYWINEQMSSWTQVLMRNEDLRPIMELLNELCLEVKQEYRKVDWNSINDLFKDSWNFLMSPKLWAPSSRITVWNPEQGDIAFEISSPIDVPNLRSVWQTGSYKRTWSTPYFY